MLEKLVFQRLVSGVVSGALKQLGVLRVILGDGLDLVVVFGSRQRRQPVGIQFAAARVQLCTVILAQLRAERVDGDDYRATICFKLNKKRARIIVGIHGLLHFGHLQPRFHTCNRQWCRQSPCRGQRTPPSRLCTECCE